MAVTLFTALNHVHAHPRSANTSYAPSHSPMRLLYLPRSTSLFSVGARALGAVSLDGPTLRRSPSSPHRRPASTSPTNSRSRARRRHTWRIFRFERRRSLARVVVVVVVGRLVARARAAPTAAADGRRRHRPREDASTRETRVHESRDASVDDRVARRRARAGRSTPRAPCADVARAATAVGPGWVYFPFSPIGSQGKCESRLVVPGLRGPDDSRARAALDDATRRSRAPARARAGRRWKGEGDDEGWARACPGRPRRSVDAFFSALDEDQTRGARARAERASEARAKSEARGGGD